MRILRQNLKRTTDTHYRHTLQTHSFQFLTQRTYSCNIFIGVRVIKEMPCSVASGTHCITKGFSNLPPSSQTLGFIVSRKKNIISETGCFLFFLNLGKGVSYSFVSDRSCCSKHLDEAILL